MSVSTKKKSSTTTATTSNTAALKVSLNVSNIASEERLTPGLKDSLHKLIDHYRKSIAAVHLSINAAESRNPRNPPSGFTMVFRSPLSKVPVQALPPSKLFNGTAVLRLNKNATFLKNNIPLNERNIQAQREFVQKALSQAFCSAEAVSDQLSEKMLSNSVEAFPWSACCDGFASINVSTEKGETDYESTIWVVVNSGLPALSNYIYHLAESSEVEDGKGITVKDFVDHPIVRFAHEASKRNRRRMLAKFCELLNISNVEFIADAHSVISKIQLVEPTLETVTNYIDRVRDQNNSDNHDTYVFRSATVDPSLVENRLGAGIVFCETPRFGVTIIKGPPKDSYEFGESWESRSLYGNFPVNTGRIKSSHEAKALAVGHITLTDPQRDNFRLDPTVYAKRDKAFMEKEATMGYEHAQWGTGIELRPLFVHIN